MKQQKFKLHSVEDIGGIYATAGDIPVDERRDTSDRTIYHIFFVEDPGELWMTFYDDEKGSDAPAICVMGKVAFENLTSDQKELLRGPRGFKGEKGDKMTFADLTEEEIAALRGRDGEKGEKGDKGDKGERGDKGMRGDTGLPGEKGEKGDKGDKGERGDKGEKGDMGSRGPKGDRGMQGNSGVMLDDWDVVEIINELNPDIKEYGPEAVLSANVGLSLQSQINTVISNKVYPIEYAHLVDLRNKSKLIPGRKYRIIDYVTTIVPEYEGNYYESAGIPFDIVVTALSPNMLDRRAVTLRRDNYSYLSDVTYGNDIAGLEIYYSLDTSYYNWAETVDNKGVIYYMRDHFNNETPYDHFNIRVKEGDKLMSTFSLPLYSFNNTIRPGILRSGSLGYYYDFFVPVFSDKIKNIEVSQNSSGKWVAYNKADLFIPEEETPVEPSYPYSQSDGTVYYIGEI